MNNMDRGIKNNHGAQITVSSAKIVLAPGYNRLTDEQYEAVKKDRFVVKKFKARILEEVNLDPLQGEPVTSRDAKDDDGLDGFTKAELVEYGSSLGLNLSTELKKDQLIAEIRKASA